MKTIKKIPLNKIVGWFLIACFAAFLALRLTKEISEEGFILAFFSLFVISFVALVLLILLRKNNRHKY